MTTQELHRAIARATGEDLATIQAHGFSLIQDEPPSEDDLPGQVIDWDDHDHALRMPDRPAQISFLNRTPECRLVRN